MSKSNCCDNNSVIIKQTKELTYFQCKECNTKFTWGTGEEDAYSEQAEVINGD